MSADRGERSSDKFMGDVWLARPDPSSRCYLSRPRLPLQMTSYAIPHYHTLYRSALPGCISAHTQKRKQDE